MNRKFYVLRLSSEAPGYCVNPTKPHPTAHDARLEARRLAAKHVGVTFAVVEALIEVRAEAAVNETHFTADGVTAVRPA